MHVPVSVQRVVAPAAAALMCVAGALVCAPASGAAAGPMAAGVSVRPAHYDAAVPATRAYFIRALAAGRSFSDQVVVSNGDARPVALLVYPVDGLTGVTSGTVYANRQDRRRGASTWVSMTSERIVVPARSSVSVPFTVRVPAKAIPGDHLAGIAFEGAASVRSGGHFSVRLITRQVVGVEIQVAGPAARRMALRAISLRSLPGTTRASAVVTLANVGRKLCKPVLRVALTGARSSGSTTRRLDTVLPRQQIPYPLPWPSALAAGSYRATARLTQCGPAATLQAVVYLGHRLRGSGIAAPRGGSLRPSQPSAPTPWWAFVAVAFGGMGVGVLARRRSHPVA
jgi:hypothetical protein